MQQLPLLPSLWWALLLAPLLALTWFRPIWFIPLFFVAGAVWLSFRAGLILDDNLARELEGQDLLVEGQVDNIPQRAEFGQRFEFEVSRAEHAGQTVHVPRRILLNNQDFSFQPRAGETWRLLVRLNRPHGYQNPGGFDYEAYLFHNRIRAKGYLRTEIAPQLISSAPWYDIDRLRQNLGERIRAQLGDNPYAGIVVALANGDGRGVSVEQWQVLRQTGTLHLIAISGLHISLIGGIVFFVASWLWAWPGTTVLRLPAPMFGAICALLAATAYAALAGFVIPTQRALIMLTVAMSGILLRRRFAPSLLLAVAALLVLLYDPLSVMAPGFWLSFAAVAIILFAMHHDRVTTSIFYKWGYVQWAIALGM
ncbi:MAG: ComEC family DNA internalization-related competence protein, partial [Gammaproteobacteria bacterium]|nr:ComEC family DNA internalization-related competence protein [Gammaproteobacteria bacterium]